MEQALGRFELQRMELRKETKTVKGYPRAAQRAWAQLFRSLRPLLRHIPAYRLKLLERKLKQEKRKDLRFYRGFPLQLERQIDEFMADNQRQRQLSRMAALRAFRRAMGAQASAQKAMQSSHEQLTSHSTHHHSHNHKHARTRRRPARRLRTVGFRLLHPVPGHDITSGFGWRRSPFTRRRKFHGALDFGAPKGTSIRAAASGVVIFAGRMGSCGKTVFLHHRNLSHKKVVTGYCHLSRIHVRKGQRVRRGQSIGRVGSTGRSTAPHLHFILRIRGKVVNPKPYMVIDS